MELKNYKGYKLLQTNDLKEVNGTGYVLEHEKTKARISIISNDDDNKVFTIGFRTPPTNSKGIQHIIEHTVLCGSEKYPAKDPFIELAKGSLNTFLNAMTYPDKTVYPVASCNDKDFQNLMDVYLDAVFNPNIYKRQEIFKQEGWHYELETADSDLIYNGVVYNEMRGVYSSPDAVVSYAVNNALFPDSIYSRDSGGDPDVIPELTWEEYLDYHKNYYHPSNSYIYLYGDMDVEEKLAYLDSEYLSKYDYLYVPSEIKEQAPFDEIKYYQESYSLADEEELEGNTFLTYNAVIGKSTDKFLTGAFNILEYVLLDVPGAPLKQALVDAGVCADVEGQYENSMYQPVFAIVGRNSDLDKQEEFIKIIEDTLSDIAENGLNKKALLAAINHFEFKTKEAAFGRYPKGLTLGLDAFNAWLYDDALAQDLFVTDDVFAFLKDNVDNGYFENLIKEYILQNKHKAYVSVVPEKGLHQKKDKETAERLASYKKSLSDDEIQKIIEETRALKQYQSEPSTPEEIESIPILEISDIKKEARHLINKVDTVNDVTVVSHDIFTNGITYIDFYFDITDIDYDDFKYVAILSDLYKYVDTEKHTYNDLSTEIDIETGGIGVNCTAYTKLDESYSVNLCIKLSTLDNKISDGMKLVEEIIYTSDITNKKRLSEIIAEYKSYEKMAMVEHGHLTSSSRALSYISTTNKIKEAFTGVDFVRYIDKLSDNFDEMYEGLCEGLKRVQKLIFRKCNLTISMTTKLDVTEALADSTSTFISKLSTDGRRADYQLPELEVRNEGFKTASKVQYVATCGNYKDYGLEYDGSLPVLKTIMSYEYLWNNVRVLGGAYGCMCEFNRLGHVFFTSYRDPKLKETYDIYKKAYDYVIDFDCIDRDMTKYIIGTISNLDMPVFPATEGAQSFLMYMIGVTDEILQKERDEILSTDQAKIRSLAKFLECIKESKIICVLGGEDVIEESKDMFNTVEAI